MEAGNTAESIKPTSIFEKVKEFAEKEVEKIEDFVEGKAKEIEAEPAKAVDVVTTDAEIAAASAQDIIEARVTAVEALINEKFRALEERIASFNTRSGHSI